MFIRHNVTVAVVATISNLYECVFLVVFGVKYFSQMFLPSEQCMFERFTL